MAVPDKTYSGRAGGDTIHGGGDVDEMHLDDELKGGGVVFGKVGDDRIWARNSFVNGDVGNDQIAIFVSNVGESLVHGRCGNDSIVIYDNSRLATSGDGTSAFGEDGADRISNSYGHSLLNGGSGNDSLVAGSALELGGLGSDTLIGGSGNDIFRFTNSRPNEPLAFFYHLTRKESGATGAPAFEGAGQDGGDVIDLSYIDANVSASGNNTFIFGGQSIGHVWLTENGSSTIVLGNTNKLNTVT